MAQDLDYRFRSSNDDPADARARLHAKWEKAQRGYAAAGQPFGDSLRALEVWIEYGRCTTSN